MLRMPLNSRGTSDYLQVKAFLHAKGKLVVVVDEDAIARLTQGMSFQAQTIDHQEERRALSPSILHARGRVMKRENDKLKPRIGFIGMGHMGTHMAQRLLDAGYQVTVYDRTHEKAQRVGQWGAQVAQTPKDLAVGGQVVLACVTDDQAQHDVMFDPDGALAGVQGGSVIIDLSTVSPDASRRLFQAAKEKNVSMIDAAVSGSVPQIEQGGLVIFVGGEHTTYEQCKPLLDVLGKNSFYMGASGMGTTMKLAVNTLLGLGMQALAEALALGEKAGLEKELGLFGPLMIFTTLAMMHPDLVRVCPQQLYLFDQPGEVGPQPFQSWWHTP